jgi:hypothetical protein
MEEAKILIKTVSGLSLNAILPIIGGQNKARFNFKKLNFERMAESEDDLYNVASSTAS